MATNNTEDMTDAKGSGRGDHRDAHGQSRIPRMTEADFLSNRYKMAHRNRGVAVIINNNKFLGKTGMRNVTGGGADVHAVYTLFNTLGFESIKSFENKTAHEIKEILRTVATLDHTENDCFVCVILTRGEEGYVFATDDRIPVDELVQPFKGDVCESLAGKPKLFFIQACRSTPKIRTLSDGPHLETGEMEDNRLIPTEADFLMVYSVIPGDEQSGSWFIQTMADVVSKNWQTMDLLTMLTRANNKVAKHFESNHLYEFQKHKNQIPCITSMLTKDVYFKK